MKKYLLSFAILASALTFAKNNIAVRGGLNYNGAVGIAAEVDYTKNFKTYRIKGIKNLELGIAGGAEAVFDGFPLGVGVVPYAVLPKATFNINNDLSVHTGLKVGVRADVYFIPPTIRTGIKVSPIVGVDYKRFTSSVELFGFNVDYYNVFGTKEKGVGATYSASIKAGYKF